jgi:8-oxo-dGTP pyrophosphatase MutT (NUDIX family)
MIGGVFLRKLSKGGYMDYIRKMRERIGHEPLLLVGAAVLLIKDGRLLMMRRTDNHAWGIPGGALEPGETLEETARRETLEETGLVVVKLSLFDVFSGAELYYRYPNGDEVYNVTAAYLAEEVDGEIQLSPAEHSEYGFFPLHDLPEKISPPIMPILKRLQNNSQA